MKKPVFIFPILFTIMSSWGMEPNELSAAEMRAILDEIVQLRNKRLKPEDLKRYELVKSVAARDLSKNQLTWQEKRSLEDLAEFAEFMPLIRTLLDSEIFMQTAGDLKEKMLARAAYYASCNELSSLLNFRLLVSRGCTMDWPQKVRNAIWVFRPDQRINTPYSREIYTHAVVQSLLSDQNIKDINLSIWACLSNLTSSHPVGHKHDQLNSLFYFGFSVPEKRNGYYPYPELDNWIKNIHARRVHRMAYYLQRCCSSIRLPTEIAFYIAQLHYGSLTDADKELIRGYQPDEFLKVKQSKNDALTLTK